MINDTMIKYTPETGYPVTEVGRRRRVRMTNPPPDPWRQRLVRWAMYALAWLLIAAAAGWVVAGVAGSMPAVQSRIQAERSAAELRGDWALGPVSASQPGTGEAWATLSIPAIGLMDMVVLEGTEGEQINVGVGHYSETEFPWEGTGNVGLAGHRTGWGEPFADLDQLRPGDQITVETADTTYTYAVTGGTVVAPEDVWVLQDTPPADTGARGDAPLLTLTTCEGGENEVRLIVWAQLSQVTAK